MFLIEGKGASEGIAIRSLLVKPAKAQSSASPISTLAPEQEVARFQGPPGESGSDQSGKAAGESPGGSRGRRSRHF